MSIDLSYLKHQPIEYSDKLGNTVKLHLEVQDWVLEEIQEIIENYPDPVEGRKAAEMIVWMYNVAYAKGLTAQADSPTLAIIEGMAMFDESPEPPLES